MGKSQKIILFIIIILILLLAMVIGIFVKIKQKMPKQDDYISVEEIPLEKKLQPLTVRNNYYTVKNCVNKYYSYYMAIFDIEKDYYTADQNTIKEAQDQNLKALYNMLDPEYKNEKEVTTENLLEKISKISSGIIGIKEIYVSEASDNVYIYIVNGNIRENDSQKTVPFELIVKVDSFEQTFTVMPSEYVKEKYANLKVGDELKTQLPETIAKNENNTYNFQAIKDDTYARDLLNEYKIEALYFPEIAYDRLNEEYKKAKFTTLEEYKTYIEKNKDRYTKMEIDQYQKTETDNYKQYVCIDKNGNTYIFRETSVMNCETILDTYTIDLPEFVETYNNSKENEKVLLNIQKVISAINEKDYKYIYNKLDSTFKENYFKTQKDLEEYLSKNLYENNNVSYGNYEKNGDVYIYTIQIKNKNNEADKVLTKKIVMQLKEGTDFVMSFNVD